MIVGAEKRPFDDVAEARAALEALTAAHPGWVAQRICVPDFARRYGTPMTSWRPPASKAKQDELIIGNQYDVGGMAPDRHDRTDQQARL